MPLSPSQRIHIIKGIAQRLALEEWPLIDLTLKQFGLPWSDGWDGTRETYILQMISEASAEALIGLGVHVGVTDVESAPRIEPPFWRAGMLRVFVSHLAAHKAFAAELQEACESFGLSCFVAHNDIEPTAEWQTQIETALVYRFLKTLTIRPTPDRISSTGKPPGRDSSPEPLARFVA